MTRPPADRFDSEVRQPAALIPLRSSSIMQKNNKNNQGKHVVVWNPSGPEHVLGKCASFISRVILPSTARQVKDPAALEHLSSSLKGGVGVLSAAEAVC